MRTKRWPMLGAAAALLAGAVMIHPGGAGAVSTPAPEAAVFANGDYVDDSAGGELENVITTLTDGGVVISEFTGITAADFTAALTDTDVLVIPELEAQDAPGDLANDMGPESRAVVKAWVDAGGRLVVFGSDTPWVDVDAIFATSYAGEEYNEVCDEDAEADPPTTLCAKQPVAAATEFAESPDFLGYNNDTSSTPVNLPAGAKDIYTWTGGEAAVTVIPQGFGSIVFLAYDWFRAYSDAEEAGTSSDAQLSAIPNPSIDAGWFTVLVAATDATIAVGDANAIEGFTETFTVRLPNGPVSQDVVASFATADGTAVAGLDYTAVSGTVVIPAGAESAEIQVATLARPGTQGTRTFDLNVDAPYFAQVADGLGVGTIDDAVDPTTSVAPTTAPAVPAARAVVASPRFAG